MEEGTEHEGENYWLEYCQPIPVEILQEEVTMQVLMDYTVPFPIILIEIGSVPKILIELAIGETGELCVKIRTEVECQKEWDEPSHHNRLIPRGKYFLSLHSFEEHVY